MPFLVETLASTLKAGTAARHAAAEQQLLPRLETLASLREYRALLYSFYGYFAPVQEKIRCFLTADDLPDIAQRRTSLLLLNDLHALGELSSRIPLCESLPDITNKASAFGALYVLEGSTLGGRMIARMLQKKLPLSPDSLQFFNGYGEATGAYWTRFLAALNEQPAADAVVHCANETFLHFENWLARTLYGTTE